MYPGELLFSNPREFIMLLSQHLSDETIAKRILAFLLEDIIKKGKEGQEAFNSLLNGKYEAFRSLTGKIVMREAKKWSRKLIS